MSKAQRGSISRIKLENLPQMCQDEVKAGPLGVVRKEQLRDDQGVLLHIGPWLTFHMPEGIAIYPF